MVSMRAELDRPQERKDPAIPTGADNKTPILRQSREEMEALLQEGGFQGEDVVLAEAPRLIHIAHRNRSEQIFVVVYIAETRRDALQSLGKLWHSHQELGYQVSQELAADIRSGDVEYVAADTDVDMKAAVYDLCLPHHESEPD